MLLATHPSLRHYFTEVIKQSPVPRKHGEERDREKERERWRGEIEIGEMCNADAADGEEESAKVQRPLQRSQSPLPAKVVGKM